MENEGLWRSSTVHLNSFGANVGHVGNIFAYRCFLFAVAMLPVTSWEPPNNVKPPHVEKLIHNCFNGCQNVSIIASNNPWEGLFGGAQASILPVFWLLSVYDTENTKNTSDMLAWEVQKIPSRRLFWCHFLSFKPFQH